MRNYLACWRVSNRARCGSTCHSTWRAWSRASWSGRGRRQEAERAQMVEAGQRAMRACLDRARDELARQLGEYRAAALDAIRADGAARMQHAVDALARAREERRAEEADRALLPGEQC